MARRSWGWGWVVYAASLASLSACVEDDAPPDASVAADAQVLEPVDAGLDGAREPMVDAQSDAASDGAAADAEALEDAQASSDASADGGDGMGPLACACADPSSWQLSNIAPCLYAGPEQTWLYSSQILESGLLDCGTVVAEQPAPPTPPAPVWATSSIELRCTGAFEVCWEIHAGSYLDPKPSDCVVTRACTSFDYPVAGERMVLPDLPSWVSDEHACAEAFRSEGGYGQATLRGARDACGAAMTEPVTFVGRNYCRPACVSTPDAPECSNCGASLE